MRDGDHQPLTVDHQPLTTVHEASVVGSPRAGKGGLKVESSRTD
jgi:hypothetical protein